jgi:aryl-alcohol dehydrogenase-like predicted oxidoreductase
MLGKTMLNGTDLSVSRLCYGTNMLGWMLDQGKSNAILDRFVELGGNFIDTARSYGDWMPDGPTGASERAIGTWLKTRNRADVIVLTKGGMFDLRRGDWRNRCTPADVEQDLLQSLDHLGIDRIDLYVLHMDNPDMPVEPLIDALVGHQEAGRIRHVGASNWAADRIVAANAYAASIGKPGFVASETFWGLAAPDPEVAGPQGYQHYYEGEYEALHAQGLAILAYAAQSGGYFTKLAKGEVNEQLAARYGNPVNQRRFAAAKALAEKHAVSINKVVLAYLLCQRFQTIAIFGGSSVEQIDESIRAVALKLAPDELALLRAG